MKNNVVLKTAYDTNFHISFGCYYVMIMIMIMIMVNNLTQNISVPIGFSTCTGTNLDVF